LHVGCESDCLTKQREIEGQDDEQESVTECTQQHSEDLHEKENVDPNNKKNKKVINLRT